MSKINKRNRMNVSENNYEEDSFDLDEMENAIEQQEFDAVSFNGNSQFRKNAHQQLFEQATMSMFGNDSYYESSDERVEGVVDAIETIVANASRNDYADIHYIANVILYARTRMNIRTMPLVMLVHFADILRKHDIQYTQLRRLTADVIQRADQVTDLYAYALHVFGNKKRIPMAIKRGVADAMNNFNEYQFAKYNRKGAVKMADVLRIVHPKAKNVTQGEIFEKIINDTLDAPYTWEVELSRNGQLPEEERKSKKEIWTELLRSGKLGYMALLRNLRNIVEAEVDSSTMEECVYNVISDPERVKLSKQLPFRFVSAIESVEDTGDNELMKALSTALDISVDNVPVIGDRIWIIVDASGSMMGGYRRGNTAPFKTASILAAALAKKNSGHRKKLKVTLFSDYAKHVAINHKESVLSISKNFLRKNWGYGTNLRSALQKKRGLGFQPDTVIILSDMQVNDLNGASVNIFADNTVKIAVNLDAYQSTPLSQIQGWYQLAGLNERMFDFIPAMREGKSIVDSLTHPYRGIEGV